MREKALSQEGLRVLLEGSAARLISVVPTISRRKLQCKFVRFLVEEIVKICYGRED